MILHTRRKHNERETSSGNLWLTSFRGRCDKGSPDIEGRSTIPPEKIQPPPRSFAMNPRGTCRLSLIATLITALAVLAICPKAVFAQSTNRQIGTQFEVTAEPLVPRPQEQPCVVPLFANYQFAFFSESTQTFEFAPGNCSGPWEKVVFEADFSENGGIQFDRTASLYLAN